MESYMKQELEDFFKQPLEELLKTRKAFTFQESLSFQPQLSVRAMACFNLALDGYQGTEEEYREVLKDELEFLMGTWGMDCLV